MFVVPGKDLWLSPITREGTTSLPYWELFIASAPPVSRDMVFIAPYYWGEYIRRHSPDTVIMLEFNRVDFDIASIRSGRAGGYYRQIFNIPEIRSDYTKLVPRRLERDSSDSIC